MRNFYVLSFGYGRDWELLGRWENVEVKSLEELKEFIREEVVDEELGVWDDWEEMMNGSFEDVMFGFDMGDDWGVMCMEYKEYMERWMKVEIIGEEFDDSIINDVYRVKFS